MNGKRNPQPPLSPRLGRYRIDTARSAVAFRGRHLFGLLPVRGTLALRDGTVDVAEPLADSAVVAEVGTASFRTGNDRRDLAVVSRRFLDAERHPVMTFVSRRVTHTAVDGTLTVSGVSRPVVLTVERSEVSGDGFTVRATARVDRTVFGVTAARGLAGRYLEVSVEIACVPGEGS
ncbi:YceI family protein [Streptomyces sp. JJ36]|uniref:YceI family protein n=1 Tax=Streptomyces sp. JJ36 TaxID=2736645 RepID=UPI001F1FD441|nr:YceI family protein [Streptomyces sp. JJ36]MCF6525348.1 YceI family protein [Streptomyces sp. JJ36]